MIIRTHSITISNPEKTTIVTFPLRHHYTKYLFYKELARITHNRLTVNGISARMQIVFIIKRGLDLSLIMTYWFYLEAINEL